LVELKVDVTADHRALGLNDEQIMALYRTMLQARRLDDRMWALNRQGRAPFVVSSSGHEGTQVASVLAMDPDIDWCLPYYRDVGVVLAWGFRPLDIFLGVFSRESDVTSGGRQMPNHWSQRERRIFSHSSPIATQYPHAAGIAYAIKKDGGPGVVAVYGGEGSTSEGDWHEAMNFAGIHRLPMIVIIENNQYAISVPVAEEVAGQVADRALGYGMHGVAVDGNDPLAVYAVSRDAVERARRGDGPTLIEAKTYRYYAHTSDDDDKLYRSREEVETWRRRDPLILLKQYLIETRLLSEELEEQLESEITDEIAEAVKEAEAAGVATDPLARVYARPIEPGEPVTDVEPEPDGDEVNIVTAINQALHEVMAAHPQAIIFGEDVADPKGGAFKATQGLTEAFGKERCFNTPLAEALIVGVGVGLAAAGKTPMPEIQFADFIHPAFDQILSEVARIHYRTNGDWQCPMVIRAPYGGGIHGALYHSQSIEAFYAHIPGLKVVIPSTPADAKGLLVASVEDPDPVLFLEPKKLYRLAKGPYPAGAHRVPLGKAAIRRAGTDLTIVAYGAMSHFSVEAAGDLEEQGISAEVIDLRSIKPLDWPTIEASLAKTGRLLIVHEDNEFVGFGAEIAAQAADKAFELLDAPVRRYATPDVPAFPFATELEAMVMPNTAGIVQHALELVEY
jgi:2-oxoisovalerate dehydrogenase E1 component